MAEKLLTEAGWKAFVKAQGAKEGYKDAALLKALSALDKAERSGATKAAIDAQLDALIDIGKQSEALRKAGKADKALVEWLDGMVKAVDRAARSGEQASRAIGDDDEDDDGAPAPAALLTSKMVPLIRQVRKGDVVLQSLLAVAGKDAAVLLSRKSIAAARRKLLAEHLGNASGIKYLKAECLLENGMVTFVVAAAAGSLAKKVKQALLQQTGLRVKINVRA